MGIIDKANLTFYTHVLLRGISVNSSYKGTVTAFSI